MHKSPSLFFDILTEEDAARRDEKIRRASFEIKTSAAQNGTSPPPPGATANGHTPPPGAQQQQQQQPGLTAAGPDGGTPPPAAANGTSDPAKQPPPSPFQQLVLSPQEVLQELLGDLFIAPSRLAMGGQLGQGGFADVHAAELTDPVLPAFSEAVAVKRLRPEVLKSPDDLREFLTEANLLRKLQHRNIVRLRGVGANDLSDLVAMRESMFVVQEFMAGGDLKALVLAAMASPFDPPYSKAAAFKWAMEIAEAMHYLHSVCKPMIIHRDLKLDNVLLTGGHMNERVAKLADFGLHKRVRKMVSSGALVAWNQETTYHGGEYERSFYGGKLYLHKSAMSVASSARDDESLAGSLHGGSTHGGGGSGGGSWHRGGAAAAALAAAASANGGGAEAAGSGGGPLPAVRANSSRPPLPPSLVPRVPSRPSLHGAPAAAPWAEQPASAAASLQAAQLSDSAASLPMDGDGQQHQQQRQQKEEAMLVGVVRAKSQGLMGKQDFVAQVLSVPSAKSYDPHQNSLADGSAPDKEVARTFAAVQALEGSVRAGSAFFQQPQAQQQPQQLQQQLLAPAPSGGRHTGGSGINKLRRQQSELCPVLVQQLQSNIAAAAAAGAGAAGQDSQKFIEATQKVGSVMYMAPEVLTGNTYNEKIDVFAFGVILYELLGGVVVASRVALAGEHSELLDYARSVANGHREPLPAHWPAGLRSLIAACWAQEPRERPSFKEVLVALYRLKQEGADAVLAAGRPSNYDPLRDCGCTIC